MAMAAMYMIWRMRRRTSILVITVGVFLIVVAPASATNFASRFADNSLHSYFYVAISNDTQVAANHGLARLSATDMSIAVDNSCVSATDVCVYDGYYTGSWWAAHYGRAACAVVGSGSNCDRWTVEFNQNFTESYSVDKLKKAGCHELGHTVGLKHYDDYALFNEYGCMWESINASKMTDGYSLHDRTHINGRY